MSTSAPPINNADPNERTGPADKANTSTNGSRLLDEQRRAKQELGTWIKLTELYALHVLPRNGEWSFAGDFITTNDLLPEKRRKECLEVLEVLEHESATRAEGDVRPHDHNGDAKINGAALTPQSDNPEVMNEPDMANAGSNLSGDKAVLRHADTDFGSHSRSMGKSASSGSHGKARVTHVTEAKSGLRSGRSYGMSPAPSIWHDLLVHRVDIWRKHILLLIQSTRSYPSVVIQTVLLVIGLILALKKGDVRAQIRKITGTGWHKISDTIKMGFSASHL